MRVRKSKIKMEWCYYFNGENKRKIYFKNISQEDYNVKYRGNLTCINGCKAKIKLTKRKNGDIFLSTWNKEGNKHKFDCPYFIEYKGERGRKKLLAEMEKIKPNDEYIKKSLQRKLSNLLKEIEDDNSNLSKNYTNEIINTGIENIVAKEVDKDGIEDRESIKRITYIEAETINSSYDNMPKGIIGIVDNVQYELDENGDLVYGYINLKNKYNRTNVYFPESYYEGNEFKFNDLQKVLKIIKEKSQSENNDLLITCYGKVKLKENTKNDYNINIINPDHILINGMSINEIFIKGKIKDLPIKIEI